MCYSFIRIGDVFMAKRGRPSNKTLRKKKYKKQKNRLNVIIVILIILIIITIALCTN